MNEWARKIRDGNPRALARAATGIENRDARALETLGQLPPGHARIVGITGPPGAGKSTLVDAMATALRAQGKTLAVIAVDPSSQITGGAILGDRIRMQQHHADPGIFIRSMATRGTTGGVARATADMAHLMDASGKDFVIIETVGVGQDEVDVAGLAQLTVVVLVPGLGDDVQAIKAGIMEIADVFVINKADQPGADRVELELQSMLTLVEGRHPPIVRTVATDGRGVDELLRAVSQDFEAPPRRPAGARHVSIDHVGIAVASLEKAIPFYQALGLTVTRCEAVDAETLHVAMLPAGDSRIELLEAAVPGLHHVALKVPDLAAAVDRLRSAGARLLDEPRTGARGQLCVFVDPASAGGVLLELIQEGDI
jgi:LAO/AO transport system kinase